MKSVLKALLILFLIHSITYTQTAEWQQTNGPLNGDVNAMTILSSDSIIAGTRLGGIYRSTDGGYNWQHVEISSFLFNAVWEIKQNSKGDIFAATSNGVYRSVDRGDTWEAFTEGLNSWFVEGLVINSIDVIFAGTRSGVFRSEDNGETWQEFNTGLSEFSIQDVSITAIGDVIVSTQNGIFISNNNGDNWTEISEGLSSKYVYTVFPVSEDTLLAGTLSGGYISTNHGVHWEKLQDIFSVIFSFERQSDSQIYAGSTGYFFSSADSGVSWQQTFTEKLDFATFTKINATPEKLIASTQIYGVMQSTDSGATWQQTNAGLKISDSKRFATNASGDIFLGSAEGIYRTTDGGDNWEWISDTDMGTNTRAFDISPSGRIFASMSGNMLISDDNGDSWDYADTSLSEGSPESIAFGNGDDVYVGFWGEIFKSSNGGDTWSELADTLPQTTIQAITVADDGTVFAGTRHNGVLRSTNGGTSWEEVNSGLGENFNITDFEFLSTGDLLLSAFDGVFKTIDNGDSWEKLGNPPNLGLKSLALDSHGNMFISIRGGGVAVSEDSGMTWEYINTGLYQKDAQGLYIDDMDNIFLGSRGAGVFKTQFMPITVAIEDDINMHQQAFKLHQNYPNPFNPITNIQYNVKTHLNASPLITLKVFDITGREIKALVDQKQSAGEYNVTFDARGLASGIYFYRLETKNFSRQMKMLLIK